MTGGRSKGCVRPTLFGSVRQLADDAGAVTLARSFVPYGDVLTSAGTGTTSYGFTGEQFDGSTGLLLRARYYADGVGRFATRDPWVGAYNQPTLLNRWVYVESNPISLADPSGKFFCIEFPDIRNQRCQQWVTDALQVMSKNGAVGQFVADAFTQKDLELFSAQPKIIDELCLPWWVPQPGPGINIEFLPGVGGGTAPPGTTSEQHIILDVSVLDQVPTSSPYTIGHLAHEIAHAALESPVRESPLQARSMPTKFKTG